MYLEPSLVKSKNLILYERMKLSTLVFGGLIGYSAASVAKVRASQFVYHHYLPYVAYFDVP